MTKEMLIGGSIVAFVFACCSIAVLGDPILFIILISLGWAMLGAGLGMAWSERQNRDYKLSRWGGLR